MNTKSIIKSLNLTGGEVLTLEKAKDRLEFEALPMMSAGTDKCFLLKTTCGEYCVTKTTCGPNCSPYDPPCSSDDPDPCSRDNPGCPSNDVC